MMSPARNSVDQTEVREAMELVDEAFTSYLEGLIPARPPVLQEMEAYARKARFPIVGPVVGHLFYLLTRLGGARRVFELGSGYGDRKSTRLNSSHVKISYAVFCLKKKKKKIDKLTA